MKVKKIQIISVLLYCIAFLNISWLPNYYLVKDACYLLLAIYIFINIKRVIKASDGNTVFTLFFIMVMVYASYVNYADAQAHLNTMFTFAIALAEVCLIIQIMDGRQIEEVITVFYKCQLIMVFLNDILIYLTPNLIIPNHGDALYLMGNKFSVGLAHIVVIAFFLAVQHYKGKIISQYRWKLILLTAVSIVIIIRVSCSTAIVALLLLFVFSWQLQNENRILHSVKGPYLILLASILFVFFNQIVLSIPAVQFIIEKVLGRNTTLTHRTYIFELIPLLLKGKLLWGFGYGTSYNYLMRTYGYPNTQNGLLEWVWQSGIFSVVLIVLMVGFTFRRRRNKYHPKTLIPIVAVFFVYCFISSIEIDIGISFFTILFIINTSLRWENERYGQCDTKE